jgi:hypothetical protein
MPLSVHADGKVSRKAEEPEDLPLYARSSLLGQRRCGAAETLRLLGCLYLFNRKTTKL